MVQGNTWVDKEGDTEEEWKEAGKVDQDEGHAMEDTERERERERSEESEGVVVEEEQGRKEGENMDRDRDKFS
eukprot:757112-Hanusia_phi.AAC.5